MSDVWVRRDYSLVGDQSKLAVEQGLANAKWYASPIPRERLKRLMTRSDGPAIRDTLIWFAAFVVTGGSGYLLWGTWWAVPPFLAYGVLYGSSTDSRWHECGHGTAFKTRWMNEVVYQIACFMVLREPTVWRWSHARHHTDTIIVGRDPEVVQPRPPSLLEIFLMFFGIKQAQSYISKVALHSVGKLTAEEETFIPKSEHGKVYWIARAHILIYVVFIGWALYLRSILPLMFVGLPSLYGAWHYVLTALMQHLGLAEDVLDHRLNARTVYLNPISRFIYWNMNYHVEHHMFPLVPYHALPALHEELKADLPKPYSGIIEAYREIIPTLLRQLTDPAYFVRRELPPTARSFTPPLSASTAAAE
jgi:fatty acid desaturase